MAKFDPARHRVVAVPYRDDDPEKGQHFHVDLDALVDAARQAAAGDVSRETLGDDQGLFLAKRCQQLEAKLTEAEARLAELEARPTVSEDTIRQFDDAFNSKVNTLVEKRVNAALGDLRSRVVSVEKKSTSLTTQQDPESAKISRLASLMQSFGEYIKEVETSVEKRQTDIENAHAQLAEYITDNNVKVMKLASKLHAAMQALETDVDEGKAA